MRTRKSKIQRWAMANVPKLYCVLLIFSFCASAQKVDMIVHNAKVYTVNGKPGTAQAFAVQSGKFVAVGTNKEILKHYHAKQVIDAKGKFVYPGFIDAHAHFLGYGQSLFMVDLYGAESWDEVVARVQKFAAEHRDETWIRGRGWDQNKWTGKAFPNSQKLNDLFPQTPVLLMRVDGHAAIVNQKAIDIAGITSKQKITGGEIVTDNGKLTGVLIDNAVDLVTSKLPQYTGDDYLKWLTAAQKNCFAVGLTTVADCGLMYNEVQAIDSLQQHGRLDMRMYVLLSDDTANYTRYLHAQPYKSDHMFIGGFKVYADGALGSRGACLLQPYADKDNWYGFLLKDRHYFDSIAHVIAKTPYQMCTHAIGDSANRTILNIYNNTLPKNNDRRWRIEHAQVINPADFSLFGKAHVIPSVQPTHATSDMAWAAERIGSGRMKGAYAYRQLLQQNGWLPLGTDFPVEDISPIKTFYAAVFRKDINGSPATGFQTENALTREEAIKGMTIWAAKGCFLEKEVGSIEAGKKADFIILSQDLMKADEKEVLQTRVVATYVGGKVSEQ